MPSWPSQFCPLINTLQESPPDNTINSSMDRGPAKIRRRTTANIRPISFRLFLKPDQVDILDSFYIQDTFSGVEEFDFVHPRTHVHVTARFTAPPSYQERSGTGYEASISLEILP